MDLTSELADDRLRLARLFDRRPFLFLGYHWIFLLVVGAFVAAIAVIPIGTAAPVSDDWVYSKSVNLLLNNHQLKIGDLSVASLVFQVVWGSLISALTGFSFGSLRFSTLLLVGGGAVGLYVLCRSLDIGRVRSALGAAIYLFNPLNLVLAFTFMTDAPYAALMTLSTSLYAVAFKSKELPRITVFASCVASADLLIRQEGALIPLAVAFALICTGRVPVRARSLLTLSRVGGLPLLTAASYYLWLKYVNGIPFYQRGFRLEIQQAGWNGTWALLQRLTFIEIMYLGLFFLPLAASAVVAVPSLIQRLSLRGRWLIGVWLGILVGGLLVLGEHHESMPYVPQFLGSSGLGPADLLGGRPALVSNHMLGWLTALCALASAVFALAMAGLISRPPVAAAERGGVLSIVLWVGLFQVAGALIPSYHFRNWAGSLDRYLLPLLPFAIALGLAAFRRVRLLLPIAWLLTGLIAAFAIAATRDFLVFQGATWSLDEQANRLGISNIHLDGGSSWDGVHLYDYSISNHISPQTKDGPFWVYLFAPATDSEYVVSGARLRGYEVVTSRSYSSWLLGLEGKQGSLFLLHRETAQP